MTWAHLLPARAAYDGASVNGAAPSWLRSVLASREGLFGHGRDETCHVPVAWGHLPENWNRGDGLVAFNCKGLTNEALAGAGFTYSRRFAVLPTLAAARWFVPLDNPSLSSAALSLYTPTRASARFKRFLARAAMHLRVPFWYRDSVWIAARREPPLERTMRGLFPDADVRLALSAGAPEPARNRKASIVVLGPGGQILAFGKAAASQLSKQIAAHEARALQGIAKLLGERQVVPQVLFSGDVDGVYVTAQTPLRGRPTGPRLTPAIQTFLRNLQTPETKPAARTSLVEGLPVRIDALPAGKAELSSAFDSLLPKLEALKVQVTVIHGDFAPWNLREDRGEISAFDWEYAELDGLPLFDETHFRLQVGFQLHKWTPEQARTELCEWAATRPLGLKPAEVVALQAIYLVDNLTRLLAEGYPESDEMVGWYLRLLALSATHREAVAV
jgi:hypothetical protein